MGRRRDPNIAWRLCSLCERQFRAETGKFYHAQCLRKVMIAVDKAGATVNEVERLIGYPNYYVSGYAKEAGRAFRKFDSALGKRYIESARLIHESLNSSMI